MILENTITSGEYCNVVNDKKHPDRWKMNKGFCCRRADQGKREFIF